MRIYILSTLKKNMLAKLEPYFVHSRYISYIWSSDGLLQIENEKIYRMKIKDVPAKKTLLGAFPVTIDESEFIREEECYQIAPRTYKEYATLKTYRMPQHSSALELILEYKGDDLYDNYFSCPAGTDIQSIKAEILQFLNI